MIARHSAIWQAQEEDVAAAREVLATAGMGEEEAPVVWISDGREIYGNALFFLQEKRWFALAWFCSMGSSNIYNECCLGLYEAMLSICLQFVLKHLHGQGMTPNQPADWGTRKSSEVLPSPSKIILVGPTCKEFSTSWNKKISSIWSNLSFLNIHIVPVDCTNCNGSLIKFLFLYFFSYPFFGSFDLLPSAFLGLGEIKIGNMCFMNFMIIKPKIIKYYKYNI